MAFLRQHHFNNRRHPERHDRHDRHDRHEHHDRHDHPDRSRQHQNFDDLVHPDHTGSEAEYFKSLIDSHAKVTVKLTDGERLHGFIRYYDHHCFSIGLSAEGPRIFLRKASVAYIAETEEPGARNQEPEFKTQ
jgi:small nuclear ribonucleoprotein (snRNP)-like protein